MEYTKVFKMPTRIKIAGRKSTITNAFINSILPVFQPKEEEIKEALDILGMSPDSLKCAYCGEPATEWDHLNPLVKEQLPTGYISEIHNLVPACGKCNQSKGNKEWEGWINSNAKHSPKMKDGQDLADRISRLKKYEAWGKPIKIDIIKKIGDYEWKKFMEKRQKITDLMKDAQEQADRLKVSIKPG